MEWLKPLLWRKRQLNLRLHRAAETGDAEQIQNLLAEGADKERKDADGQTALHSAAVVGQAGVVEALLQSRRGQGSPCRTATGPSADTDVSITVDCLSAPSSVMIPVSGSGK